MGQILHGCATTTASVRRAIQNSEESLKTLAERYNINVKTVAKWRKRREDGVEDKSNRPKKVNCALTEAEELAVCLFRQKTQLPLDDCLDALQETIPALTRSNLHRCLKRHGLNRLPKKETTPEKGKKKFKDYDIGYVHVDITEIRIAKEKFYLFVGIDRISKYAYVELHTRQTVDIACTFIDNLVEACPFKIHTILTDNGSQFAFTKLNLSQNLKKRHRFDLKCQTYGIRHKRTKPYTPQTNGQVERFNKTIKEATVHKYHYENVEQLSKHLQNFITAYNCGKKLSAIKRNTPIQECIKWWTNKPKLFRINPHHQLLRLNS